MKATGVIAAALFLCTVSGALGTGAFADSFKTIESSSPQEIVGGKRCVLLDFTGVAEYAKKT